MTSVQSFTANVPETEAASLPSSYFQPSPLPASPSLSSTTTTTPSELPSFPNGTTTNTNTNTNNNNQSAGNNFATTTTTGGEMPSYDSISSKLQDRIRARFRDQAQGYTTDNNSNSHNHNHNHYGGYSYTQQQQPPPHNPTSISFGSTTYSKVLPENGAGGRPALPQSAFSTLPGGSPSRYGNGTTTTTTSYTPPTTTTTTNTNTSYGAFGNYTATDSSLPAADTNISYGYGSGGPLSTSALQPHDTSSPRRSEGSGTAPASNGNGGGAYRTDAGNGTPPKFTASGSSTPGGRTPLPNYTSPAKSPSSAVVTGFAHAMSGQPAGFTRQMSGGQNGMSRATSNSSITYSTTVLDDRRKGTPRSPNPAARPAWMKKLDHSSPRSEAPRKPLSSAVDTRRRGTPRNFDTYDTPFDKSGTKPLTPERKMENDLRSAKIDGADKQKKIDELTRELRAVKDELYNLQQEMYTVNYNVEPSPAMSSIDTARADRLQDTVDTLELEMAEMQSQLSRATGESNEARGEIDRLGREASKLREELRAASRAAAEAESLRTQMQREKSAAIAREEELRNEMHRREAEARQQSYSKAQDELSVTCDRLKQELQQMRESQMSQQESSHHQLLELQSRQSAAQLEHEAEVRRLEGSIREARSAGESEIASLKAQLQARDREVEGLRSSLSEKESISQTEARRHSEGLAALDSQLREAVGQREQRIREMQGMLEDRDRELSQLRQAQTEATRLSSELSRIEHEKMEALSRVDRLSADHSQHSQMVEAQLREKDSQLTQMQRELHTAQDEARQALGRVEQLQEATRSTQEQSRLEHESEIRRLRDALENAQSEASRQADAAGQSSRRTQELEEEVSQLRQQLRQAEGRLDTDLAQYRARIEELERELAAKDELIAQLRRELEAARAEVEAAKAAAENKLAAFKDDVEASRASAEELAAMVRYLQNESKRFDAIRREMHNKIQELKGNIRVFVRVRPALDMDRSRGTRCPITLIEELTKEGQQQLRVTVTEEMTGRKQTFAGREKAFQFRFDRIFEGSDQHEVFAEINQLVQSALDGYRVCIFAYGQTGSGKTFTMEGEAQRQPELAGVIPRAVEKIFACTSDLHTKGWQFTVECSFLEIYNEEVRDLLAENPSDERLDIKHIDGKTVVPGLRIARVTGAYQVLNLLKIANNNRATYATRMNDRSSRSHSVFQLYISGHNPETRESANGMLNLIDLAGSERLAKSDSQGLRLKEAQNINRSLHVLADVITSLANKEPHVPFRNSKLTYLLQESLGGDCKMLMFANVASEPKHVGETLCSLRFADKVNKTNIGVAHSTQKINLTNALENAHLDDGIEDLDEPPNMEYFK